MVRDASLGPSIESSPAVPLGNHSASAGDAKPVKVVKDVKKAKKEDLYVYDPDAEVQIDAEDMPKGLSASFKQIGHHPEGSMKLLVRASVEEQFGHNNQVRRKAGTGVSIRFSVGLFETKSLSLAHWLLNHKSFNKRFTINEDDPGGYWRHIGYVEEYPVTATRLVRKAV